MPDPEGGGDTGNSSVSVGLGFNPLNSLYPLGREHSQRNNPFRLGSHRHRVSRVLLLEGDELSTFGRGGMAERSFFVASSRGLIPSALVFPRVNRSRAVSAQ